MPNKGLRIYFAGSISGGRDFEEYQIKIVDLLKSYGYKILTEHVSSGDLQKKLRQKAKRSTNYFRYIARHDRRLINRADLLVAECSQPSLGVGFEVCYAAYKLEIPVIVLGHEKARKRFSAMVFGDSSKLIRPYFYNDKNLEKVLQKALTK